VRLAGTAVNGLTPAELARLRVLIPQEAYVFSGTVRENLAYLCDRPPADTELSAVAAALGLDELVDRLGGLDAGVDPAALSAGESQLFALARAHLSPAPLVLLDEATCHLDPAAEARAENAFAGRPGTLVVIAHRITSARRADRVLLMDGLAVTCGTHRELLAGSGLYRDLVGHWDAGPEPDSHPAGDLRDTDRVHPVTGPGLAGDGRHVVAHGPVGQMQTTGDLGDGGTLRGQ
jgi:ATP-binding cassette subfamily C protein